MALYAYRCHRCNSSFERLEPVSAPAPRQCPGCGGEAERVLGVPMLQFKGSGWYVTDYGGGARKTPASASSGDVASRNPTREAAGSKGSTAA